MPFDDRSKLTGREWLMYMDCLFFKVDCCIFSGREVYFGLLDSLEQGEDIVIIDQNSYIIYLRIVA